MAAMIKKAVPPKFSIKPATSPSDLNSIKRLFSAYAASLKIDLSFQNFSAELDSLPGLYALPTGALFLAVSLDNEAIGCVGLRPLTRKSTPKVSDGGDEHEPERRICEMKRLYCTPASRGLGVGRALVEEVIKEAEKLGYEEMRLDTLSSMSGARKLYAEFGFSEIEAYYQTPLLDTTVFLGKKLGEREVDV